MEKPNSTKRDNYIVFAIGVILIFILLYGVFTNIIEDQCRTVNTILSLAAAAFAMLLTGRINTDVKLLNISIKAGGTLAVFFLCFWYLVVNGCENQDIPTTNNPKTENKYDYEVLTISKEKPFKITQQNKDISIGKLVIEDGGIIVIGDNVSHFKLMSDTTRIGKNTTINLSGANGANGKAGTNNSSHGSRCNNGQPGGNGDNGSNGKNSASATLKLFNIEEIGKLHINAQGGKGGNGGNGGNGSNGGGADCSSNCRGANGGQGGSGGNGGKGGKGGQIEISYSFSSNFKGNTNIRELITSNTSGGKLGSGGQAGNGGAGGGGKKCSGLYKKGGGSPGARGGNGNNGSSGTNGYINFDKE